MKPISFKEQNVVFAEDQPGYISLPAYRDDSGQVISCWQLTWKERLSILCTGRLWMRVFTFNELLQPCMLEANYPFEKGN